MPYFFQFSKNGRHISQSPTSKKKKVCAKQNDSTMNRICASFDDIGNISFGDALIPTFNYQMLLPEKPSFVSTDAQQSFFRLDDDITPALIEAQTASPSSGQSALSPAIVAEYVEDALIRQYGSLEAIYPSIVLALFTGENKDKASHKQLFWRIFGTLAVAAIKKNLASYTVCPKCTKSIPSWTNEHECNRSSSGMFMCEICGTWVKRRGAKQKRCDACQEKYRKEYHKTYYDQNKDKGEK